MHPDWQNEIMQYSEAQSTPEPDHLKELVRFTWLNALNPRQLSGHLQGRLLSFLSFISNPECILEIGTFTGYSALCLAEGLEPNGKVHTIEGDEETAHKAAQIIEKSPFSSQIQLHIGDALLLIPQLNLKPDLIFVDAEKLAYRQYFELCLPSLKKGGFMAFDNTLWSGKVLNPESRVNDKDTETMHAFNEYVRDFDGVDVVLLPIRDGLTLIRKH